MYVSFLIPTRRRTRYLDKLIKSIVEKSSKKRDFEILFKVDNDDQETLSFFLNYSNEELKKYFKCFVTPRGNGYADIHKYTNFLCEYSSGEWLFIFNDDCLMETDNWDDLINDLNIDGLKEPCVLEPCGYSDGPPCTFPIISRKWYEITERFSGCMYNDGWTEYIGRKLDILKHVDITVDHSIKYDINNGMQYSGKHRDITFLERQWTLQRQGLQHSAWNDAIPEMEKDCQKIREYINNVKSQ